MSGGHTPGPWEVEHGSGYGELNGWTIWNPNGDGYALAVAIGDVVALHPHVEANARLIAASPDLLEALEGLEAYLRDTPHHNAVAAAHARKVIAKARGAS